MPTTPPARTEGTAEHEWQVLQANSHLLAVAPDDEITAELLACQAELANQIVVNRQLQLKMLDKLLEELPAQAARQRQLEEEEGLLAAYHEVGWSPRGLGSRALDCWGLVEQRGILY